MTETWVLQVELKTKESNHQELGSTCNSRGSYEIFFYGHRREVEVFKTKLTRPHPGSTGVTTITRRSEPSSTEFDSDWDLQRTRITFRNTGNVGRFGYTEFQCISV